MRSSREDAEGGTIKVQDGDPAESRKDVEREDYQRPVVSALGLVNAGLGDGHR